VFFLDLPVDVAAERGQFGEERYEKLDFQRKVYANFKAMATPIWKMVDAAQTIEQIAQEVEAESLETMERVQEQPVTSFWE
jgi:dTMP kinase